MTRVALIVLLACTSIPASAAAVSKTLAYVVNADADTISVVDTQRGGVVATIALGDDLRASSVAMRPDGVVAYVLSDVTRTITVVNAATREITARIPFAFAPRALTFVSGGRFAYVSLDCGEIAVFDTRSNRVVRTISLGSSQLLAASRDGSRAYAVDLYHNAIAVIDTARHTFVGSIALSRKLVAVILPVLSPMLFAVHEDGLTMVDPATMRVVETIFAPSARAVFEVTPDGRTAYAATDNKLIVIDVSSGGEVARIDIESGPHSLAMARDGSALYITTRTGVAVLATASNTITEVIPVVGHGLRLSPAGSLLYVQVGRSVVVVDTATRTVRGPLPLAEYVDDIALTADDRVAYVVHDQGLSIVDTADNRIIKTFPAARPRRIRVSPDGTFAYVTLEGARTVAVLDTATNRVAATIAASKDEVGAVRRPHDVAFSRDGRHAYVTIGEPRSGFLAIVETATHSVTSEIPLCDPRDEDCRGYEIGPQDVVLSPDDSTAYVVLGGISVAGVDLASQRVSSIVDIGSGEGDFITDLAVTPDGSTLYAGYWFHPTDGDNPFVAVIDTASATLVERISLDGHAVSGVAFSPNGRTAYVAGGNWRKVDNYYQGGLISVIDVATNKVRAVVRTSDMANLSDVAFTEDGSLAFAAEVSTGSLLVLDAAADEVITRMPANPRPLSIAVASVPSAPNLPAPRPTAEPTPTRMPRVDLPAALVAPSYGDAVTLLVGESERVIPLGGTIGDLAATIDGREAYVTVDPCEDAFCEHGAAVAVIDIDAGAVRATIAVDDHPTIVAVTPDGTLAYVGSERCEWFYYGGESCQWAIVVIDTAARTAAARIPIRGRPVAFAIAPNGSTLYAAQAGNVFEQAGEIIAIDTATSATSWSMPLEVAPSGIAIGRDGHIVYVAGRRPLQFGEINALDARNGRLVARLQLGNSGEPSRIAVSPDGTSLYFQTVAGCSNALAIVDLERFTLTGYVKLPSYYLIDLAPTDDDGHLAYVSGGRGIAVVDLDERAIVAERRLDYSVGAAAVLCGGNSCASRPTAIPRTPPAAAPTRPPLPTRTPDACSQGNPCVSPITLTGAPGDLTVLEVILDAAYSSIGRVEHDLSFEPDTPIGADDAGHPNCVVNPDIEKEDTTFAFLPLGCTPGQDCTGIHAAVRSFEMESAILSRQVLYRCHVRIAPDALPGLRLVAVSNLTASAPGGGDQFVIPVDGTINVQLVAESPANAAGGGNRGCNSTGSDTGLVWMQLLIGAVFLRLLRYRARAPQGKRLS